MDFTNYDFVHWEIFLKASQHQNYQHLHRSLADYMRVSMNHCLFGEHGAIILRWLHCRAYPEHIQTVKNLWLCVEVDRNRAFKRKQKLHIQPSLQRGNMLWVQRLCCTIRKCLSINWGPFAKLKKGICCPSFTTLLTLGQ